MRSKLAQFILVTWLVVTIGGHWAILQSVAWARMAVSFAKDVPLVEALSKTFDGNHPCKMCKAVESGKKAEKERGSYKAESKVDWVVVYPLAMMIESMPFMIPKNGFESLRTRSESPITPPPRCV